MGNEKVVNQIVCIPTNRAKPESVYPSSIIMQCAKCGQDVYVSPNSQKILNQGGFAIECVECTVKETKNNPGPYEFRIHPGTAKEIKWFLNRN